MYESPESKPADPKRYTVLEDAALVDALFDVTSPRVYDGDTAFELHEEFVRSGYVRLHEFFTPAAISFLKLELTRLEKLAVRRVFEMPGYGTPRSLSVLGGSLIKAQSPMLYRLYHHQALRQCMELIAGRPVFPCLHPEEFMVANFLQHSGDTHGWHLDDPSYALVIFIEAPREGGGGEVEIIPNWTELCRRKNRKPDKDIANLIAWAHENGLVERRHHNVGEAYFLRADLNLHRVAPLREEGERRCVINLAFQSSPDAKYGGTADLLYGAEGLRPATPEIRRQ